MRISNIQSDNNFKGVYTPSNFSPTATQERMIKTIKGKLTKDTFILKKDKNFHNYLESKGEHFMLSNGEFKEELKVELGTLRNDNFVTKFNLGSYPENRLDNIVNLLKEQRKEKEINDTAGLVTMILLGVGIFGMILARTLSGK